jgi:hypothetical protein
MSCPSTARKLCTRMNETISAGHDRVVLRRRVIAPISTITRARVQRGDLKVGS